MRLALAQFLANVERRDRTRAFIDEWAAEIGGVDETEIAEMTARHFS